MSRKMTRASGALAAALAVATGCVDRPQLFEPVDPPAVNLTLPPGEIEVHERDSVRIAVSGQGPSLRAQLILLDSAGLVLWRSALAPVNAGVADVPVEDVPASVERGRTFLMTGVVTDVDGARYYASDDTVPAPRLADGARRVARIWAGQRVRTVDGAMPTDLTLDADRERAYFPVPAASSIGVLDLSGTGAILGSVDAGFRPGRVAYRADVLAVLGESGGELAFLRLGRPMGGPMLLPALEVELDTTFLGAVRPTGRGLAVGCRDVACTGPLALVPSALQVIEGSVAQPAAASVLRMLADADAGGPVAPALVLPGFVSVIRGDTSASAHVYTPRTPDGDRAEVLKRGDASACLATSLGGPLLAAGAPGVAYVVSPSGGEPACGPGTRIVRLDGLGTVGVSVSSLAIRNTMAEDRIEDVADLQVDDSGGSLVVLTGDAVLVLDPYLRVKGSVASPDARAVAWLRGAAGSQERFAVADRDGVTIYDAGRLTVVHRLPLGPTEGPIVFLDRADGGRVLAAPTAGGFVVASVPKD